jgi:Copper amine oxidase N-terminal domain
MSSPTTRRVAALGAAALLTAALAVPALAAGPVTVTLNGNTLNLNPAPTERAGRVFVPLRGVFENLGASVVYAGGVINATGRGHNISLRVGSQQATVDGAQQTIDVAPFIIGASTYVPLRFVSQALGATVNYDGANRVVAISASGAQAAQAPANQTITPVPNANAQGGAINITNLVPARGASVPSRRPTIEATFTGGTADPNTIKVYLDQLDVTNDSTRSPRGFSYAPRSPLQAGPHTVRVTGTDTNGGTFNRGWRFTSGTSTVSAGQITRLRPADGSTVPNTFVVSGHTTPGARVTIQVGASTGNATSIGGLIGAILGTGGGQQVSAPIVVNADGNGNFSQQISVNAPSGTQLTIALNSTDPQTGATGTPIQERVTIQ